METNNSREREALEAINSINTGGLKRLLAILVEEDIFDGGLINKTIAAVEKAKRALSEPPQNCEVGTPEEQLARFIAFCKGQRLHSSGHADTCNPKCPCRDGGDVNLCALAWAQMPYEEGGAD